MSQPHQYEEEKEKDLDLSLTNQSETHESLEDAPASKLQPNEGYDPEMVKRTMRKIDWRLIPILGALYSISLVDRTNISLAAVAGMNIELQLNIGSRYSIALLLFFVSYIIFEMFSNVFLRKFGAAIWLSLSAISFGAIMIGMGFVESWISLAVCRVLIGIFEASIFPGAVYLTSCWYVRSEMQVRLSSFYMTSVVVTGFSAIWAYGCTQIEVDGLSGWRWIFIIQGIVTVVIGIVAFFAVVDFPDQATFLNEEQKEFVKTRINRDRGDAVFDSLTWKKAGKYALDLKLWAFALCFGISTVASYALSYFLPLILRSMGFSTALSQILVAPPYIFAVLLALCTAKLSDKTGLRSPFIVFNALLVIVGLSMTRWVDPSNQAARYAGIFLAAAGCNSNVAACLGQASVNIVGQSKRAYVSALQVAAGGIGGIIASTTFRTKDSPFYTLGMWVAIGGQVLLLVVQGALVLNFMAKNRAARRGGKPVENTPGYYYQY